MGRCVFLEKERKDLPFILHILEAITNIEESISTIDKTQFLRNSDAKDANVRRLEIIDEAVKNISPLLKKKYPDVEWAKIAGTRDKIIHHYFGVNFNLVWEILTLNVPQLKQQILRIKAHVGKTEKL